MRRRAAWTASNGRAHDRRQMGGGSLHAEGFFTQAHPGFHRLVALWQQFQKGWAFRLMHQTRTPSHISRRCVTAVSRCGCRVQCSTILALRMLESL